VSLATRRGSRPPLALSTRHRHSDSRRRGALENRLGLEVVSAEPLDGEPAGDPERQRLDVRRRRFGQDHEERAAAVLAGHEEAVRQQAVDVRIEVQGAAESLHEAHRAGLTVADAERPGATPEHGAQKGAQELAE
jgi:hypothetical protein